jgi:hypothetical protein
MFSQKENISIMTKAQQEQKTLHKKPSRPEVIQAIAAVTASSVVTARAVSSQEGDYIGSR